MTNKAQVKTNGKKGDLEKEKNFYAKNLRGMTVEEFVRAMAEDLGLVKKEVEKKPAEVIRELGHELEVQVRQWMHIAELLTVEEPGVRYDPKKRITMAEVDDHIFTMTISWQKNGPYSNWDVMIQIDDEVIEDINTAIGWIRTAMNRVGNFRKKYKTEIGEIFRTYREAMAYVAEQE